MSQFQPSMPRIFSCYQRLKSFFRFSKSDSRRTWEDEGKTDFFEVWRVVMPAPFCRDRTLATRIGDLCKFTQITYSIQNLSQPWISHVRPTSFQGYKRSIHK